MLIIGKLFLINITVIQQACLAVRTKRLVLRYLSVNCINLHLQTFPFNQLMIISGKSEIKNRQFEGCLNYKEEGRDQAQRSSGNLSHPA